MDVQSDGKSAKVPAGADGQYDLLFRSFLNSVEQAKALQNLVEAQAAEIRQRLTILDTPCGTNSRVPGFSIIHRLFAKMLRRHTNENNRRLREITEAILALNIAISEQWEKLYRHEFEVERRIRAGLSDRLATVDALLVRQRIVEERLNQYASDDR